MRNALILVGLALALGVPSAIVLQKERVLAAGTPVLLELAPVDPRSLIQGDYMRLDYALTRQLADSARRWPRSGEIVVARDARGVGRFVRRRADGAPLAPGELLLPYRRGTNDLRIGTDAYHFQEGDAPLYAAARYGELRVGPSGASVLAGLRDSAGRVLGER